MSIQELVQEALKAIEDKLEVKRQKFELEVEYIHASIMQAIEERKYVIDEPITATREVRVFVDVEKEASVFIMGHEKAFSEAVRRVASLPGCDAIHRYYWTNGHVVLVVELKQLVPV